MADFKVGKVIHFYDKISVAVVKLLGNLAIGDEIKIVVDDEEFTQKVESMQIEHKKIKGGKKGDEVAIKVDKPTKKGAEIYRIS
jgi:putative protease